MEKSCCVATSPPEKNIAADKLRLYRPLIVILALSILGAAAIAHASAGTFANSAMGFFLLFLAALQLFDVRGYAESFARYDLIAARSRTYALAYPFIEAALGLLYLAGMLPKLTNIVTLVIMAAGCVGVIAALRRGEKLHCACAGTGFALPVGRVTLAEDAVMALMAVANLVRLFHA